MPRNHLISFGSLDYERKLQEELVFLILYFDHNLISFDIYIYIYLFSLAYARVIVKFTFEFKFDFMIFENAEDVSELTKP